MRIKDFIPPAIYKIRHKLQKQERNMLIQRFYAAYEDGLAACGGKGYELDDLINVVFLKTKALSKILEIDSSLLMTEAMTQSL